MDTVAPHSHSFSEADWPFSEPVNAAAFSSTSVVRGGKPVLVVYHDHDGDWQFLHGDETGDNDCLLICLGCAFQRTPEISQLATLPPGWCASRDHVGASWVREPYDDSDAA